MFFPVAEFDEHNLKVNFLYFLVIVFINFILFSSDIWQYWAQSFLFLWIFLKNCLKSSNFLFKIV